MKHVYYRELHKTKQYDMSELKYIRRTYEILLEILKLSYRNLREKCTWRYILGQMSMEANFGRPDNLSITLT